MAPVRPTTTPPLLPKATDKTEAPKGDYSVKKGDTLEKIATKLVTDSGGTATKANVAKALAALKKANPELVTAARDGGNKIRIGDQVKYPKLDAQGGWASAGAASNAGAPTKASAAAAKDQMGTLKLDKELTEAARTFSTKRPTADEAKQLNGLLERIKTDAPKLLDTPAARVLKARLMPDATSAEPPRLPDDVQSKPARREQPAEVEMAPRRPRQPLE